METKVEILKNEKVHIIIKGFNIIPYQKNSLKYKENNNKLMLILRHISRFDIKKKELMVMDGNIRIEKVRICVELFDRNQLEHLEALYRAAKKSIWTKESNINVMNSNIILLTNERTPGIEIIYGYDK